MMCTCSVTFMIATTQNFKVWCLSFFSVEVKYFQKCHKNVNINKENVRV